MAKAVKKVGRAIGKVFDGVKKVVKKAAKSKTFKVIATAAAVYFTGGAALGAIGGAQAASAAGTSMLAGAAKGAIAGLGSAGAGISGAWSNLLGGNFGAAGSSVASGWSGASAAGSAASGGTFAGSLGTGFSSTQGLMDPSMATSGASSAGTAGNMPITGGGTGGAAASSVTSSNVASMPVSELMKQPVDVLNSVANKMTAEQLAGLKQAGVEVTQSTGLMGKMLSSPLTVPMAMQIGGNALSGYAQAKDAEENEQEARDRYNHNVGTKLWQSKY